jgi:hypothetical protein
MKVDWLSLCSFGVTGSGFPRKSDRLKHHQAVSSLQTHLLRRAFSLA